MIVLSVDNPAELMKNQTMGLRVPQNLANCADGERERVDGRAATQEGKINKCKEPLTEEINLHEGNLMLKKEIWNIPKTEQNLKWHLQELIEHQIEKRQCHPRIHLINIQKPNTKHTMNRKKTMKLPRTLNHHVVY